MDKFIERENRVFEQWQKVNALVSNSLTEQVLGNLTHDGFIESITSTLNLVKETIAPVIKQQEYLGNISKLVEPQIRALESLGNVNNLFDDSSIKHTMGIVADNMNNIFKESRLSDTLINSSTLSDVFSPIISGIELIPERDFETLLEGTEYTREDVLEDVQSLKEEMENTDPKENVEKWIRKIRIRFPALYYLFLLIRVLSLFASGINEFQEVILTEIQQMIVEIQGNEDIYFVKTDSANIYLEPSSKAKVIGKIMYSESVTLIEDINMWNKVSYIDEDGNELVGWIAKRNLMTYQDYQFNSDELYDME